MFGDLGQVLIVYHRWTNQRIAFKKPLHSQAVIRAKLALMIERVEACQAWMESITHQMNNVRSNCPDFL